MATRWAHCAACGARFAVSPYNAHRQRFCTERLCVQARKRERQRRWYNRKYKDDGSFARATRQRCAEANRRRRSRTVAMEPGRAPPGLLDAAPPEVLGEVVLGLLCQLTDSADREELAVSLSSCRERGRRVAALAPVGSRTG